MNGIGWSNPLNCIFLSHGLIAEPAATGKTNMSHIAPIARDSNDYFAANHIVFAVCFVVLQFSIPELLSQLRHRDVLVADIIGVIGVLLFWIAEGCLFLLTFLHKRAKKAISHAITMIVVLVPTIFARDTLLFIQFINLYFLSGKYEACASPDYA